MKVSALQAQIQHSNSQNTNRIIIGIDFGNKNTTSYYNSTYQKFNTQLTINLSNKSLIIGKQQDSLNNIQSNKQKNNKQKLLNDHNANLNPNLNNEVNSNASQRKSKDKNIIIKDFLDLFVRFMTSPININYGKRQNKQAQNINSIINDGILPSYFSYYKNTFKQQKLLDSVAVILQNNSHFSYRDRSNNFIERFKNNKLQYLQKLNISQQQTQNQLIDAKKQLQKIYLDQCIYLFIKNVIKDTLGGQSAFNQTIKSLNKQHNQKNIDISPRLDLIINYYGFQGNSYLASLNNLRTVFNVEDKSSQKSHSNNMNNVSVSLITSTSSLTLSYYYQQHQNILKSTYIACLDFGARGISFSTFKLYPSSQKVIQLIDNFAYQFGGIDMTRIIFDMIAEHVKLHKGVNLKSTPQMIQQLYQLAEQTKIALTQVEEVFVRIEGYPLLQPYGFHLKRMAFQMRIKQKIDFIIQEINKIVSKHKRNPINGFRHIVLSGLSVSIPLFKQSFINLLKDNNYNQIDITFASNNQIAKGNYLYKSSQIIVLTKYNSQSLTIKGDQEYFQQICHSKNDLPLRFIKQIQFPRGQLNFVLKFFQNNIQIGKYIIESKYLQWAEPILLIVEKEQDKALSIYSKKYLGQLFMKGNKFCKQVLLNKNVNVKVCRIK